MTPQLEVLITTLKKMKALQNMTETTTKDFDHNYCLIFMVNTTYSYPHA
jgi:hypothetical protein